jgi:nitrous oxide reductase accessory protein NosL
MKKLLVLVSIVGAIVFAGCSNNETSAPKVKKAEVKEKGKSKKMANCRTVPVEKAELLQKGKSKMYCPVCGMTLPMFYKTNHAAKHNGHDKQYCSIHCMVEDKEVNGKDLTDFKAVDKTSLKFSPSKDMIFVVGSKKPGTMSAVSKYGFTSMEAAKKFQAKNGGEIMNFEETYTLAKERLKGDIAATKKRQAKAAKMGEKIYKKMCNQTSMRFSNPAEAKTYLSENKICGNLKGKKLQQVALYLSGKAKGMKCGSGKCGKAIKCGGGKCSSSKCGK